MGIRSEGFAQHRQVVDDEDIAIDRSTHHINDRVVSDWLR